MFEYCISLPVVGAGEEEEEEKKIRAVYLECINQMVYHCNRTRRNVINGIINVLIAWPQLAFVI